MNTAQTITHVLDRLSLGSRLGDRAKLQQLGVEPYLQQQLTLENLSEPSELENRLKAFSSFGLSPVDLFEQYAPPDQASNEERQNARRRQRELISERVQIRLLRALDSPRQLYEVMVDFWFNHFNVFANKGLTSIWTGDYEESAIRPHALGKFRDLLDATAKHPAMLFYLDNWRNTDPNSPEARGRFKGLNENYSRELMELHTLGIEGGYTQADVENLARILTGWSLHHRKQKSSDSSGFVFIENRHAPGDKTLLGTRIPGGGMEEGEAALDLLAGHPATARHISYKLAQYFVADRPPKPLVEQLAQTFSASDGNIQAVLLTLFESAEFWDDAYYQRKFKTPYQYLISVARALGMTSPPEDSLRYLSRGITQLGMQIYRCHTPDGYAQQESHWLSPDAMMRRVSLAITTVTHHNNPEAANAGELRAALTRDLLDILGDQLSAQTQRIVKNAPARMRPALLLGSPEMMYR